MKINQLQTSFLAGALDELARGRVDTQYYRNAAKSLRNCMLLAQGGVISRWGSAYCATLAAYTGQKVRIEEFTFSLAQSYIAVFRSGRIDFYFSSDGAAAGSVSGQPWTDTEIPELSVTQAGDVMWIAHGNFATRELVRTGLSSWSIAAISYDEGGWPTYRYAGSNITLTYTAGTTTLTASSSVWQAGHVGTGVLVFDETNSRYRAGIIATYVSGTQVTVTWSAVAPPDANVTRLWEEAAFSSVRGYARSVCLFQQRLVFGGALNAGDAVWMSGAARYRYFGRGGIVTDADPIAISLGTTRVRTITQTIAGPVLTFLTESAALYAEDSDKHPLTPLNLPRIRLIGPYGAGYVRASAFDGGTLFVQSSGRSVRDLSYSTEADNLVADPVSLPATGYMGTIVDAAYLPGNQSRPEQYAFFVNSDGAMVLYHSIREQRVVAWAEWTTNGLWKAVGVAGNALFAAVVRNGNLMLERFDASLAFDCSKTMASPYVLAHLPSTDLHGRNGDDYFGAGTSDVTGAVTLTRQLAEFGGLPAGQEAEVGLAFDWWIDTLPPFFELPDGTIGQRPQRLVRMAVKCWHATSVEIGAEILRLLSDGFEIGVTPTPYDGWFHAKQLGWDRRGEEARIAPRITRDIPMPLGILAIRREILA